MTPPPLDTTADRVAGPLVVPNVFVAHASAARAAADIGLVAHIGETYADASEDLIVEGLLSARLALAGRALADLFYIDIGASHPVHGNSYLFYRKHGATGVVVVDRPDVATEFRKIRPRDLVAPVADGTFCINAFLAAHADRPVDFLSVAAERLFAIDFSCHRPAVIQTAPAEHLAPGTSRRVVERLRQHGYALAARTAMHLIFTDAAATSARPSANSFDVFDTLIARRCVEPHAVFAKLEAKLGIPGFAAARLAAEAAVSGPGLTLDAIYAQLARRLGADMAAARDAEIDAELSEVIPIAENIARVQDGDLLLSDMYLPADAIRALLARAGLDRKIGLVVSADGKSAGRIWPLVHGALAIGHHLGDNSHSDVTMPRRFGIAGEHTRVSTPTPLEQFLRQAGCAPLGELIRVARLGIATPDPVLRQLLQVQTQYNFPMLALASLLLHRRTHGRSLLFASRDCHLWCDLHQAMFPTTQAGYFYTSRRARLEPSPDYAAYAAAALAPDAVLVDLVGSGWSSALMLQTLGLPDRALFFLHRIAPIALYEQQRAMPDGTAIDHIIGPEQHDLNHIMLEMTNYAAHGSAIDVRRIAGVAIPVFDQDDRSTQELAWVAAQAAIFKSMQRDPATTDLQRTIDLSDQQLADIITSLYRLLCQTPAHTTVFAQSHHREDLATLAKLGLIAG